MPRAAPFASLCFAAAVVTSPALLPAAAIAQPAEQSIGEGDLNRWLSKTNAYTELLNASLHASTSWSRYRSWVDVRTGPTGKERIVYGLYEVSPEIAKRALEASAKAIAAEPKIDRLDAAAADYAAAFEALLPVMNETSRYYERQDYKDDKFARGRDLHPKLMAVAEPYLKQRARFEGEMKAVKAVLNARQLEAIEKREGRSYAWHARNVMNVVEPIGDLIVQQPTPALAKALDEAIPEFAKAVRDFDDYLASPAAKKGMGIFDSAPRSFLGDLRDYRDDVASGRSTVGTKATFIIQHYNNLVNAANMANRMAR